MPTCPKCNRPLTRDEMQKPRCSLCGSELPRTAPPAEPAPSPDAYQLEQDAEDQFWNYLFSKWWGQFLMAGLFGVCALLVYAYLVSLEREGESGHIVWFIALAYHLGGKACAVLPFAVPAVVCGIIGVVKLCTGKK